MAWAKGATTGEKGQSCAEARSSRAVERKSEEALTQLHLPSLLFIRTSRSTASFWRLSGAQGGPGEVVELPAPYPMHR